MSERIQKVLAAAGLGSRRALEQLLADGGVQVNGTTAGLGDRLAAGDRVSVAGRHYMVREPAKAQGCRVLAYHKPEGEVCTRSDPQGRPTVFAALPRRVGRWVAVGRLDINTSGLLLFTDNGELAHRLMHPSRGLERIYAVRIFGEVDPAVLTNLVQGVELEDGPARFDWVKDAGGTGSNRWYHVGLREGRNHEVRRLWASQGLTVSRLIRIAYGPVRLDPRLRPGRTRDLDDQETAALMAAAGLEKTRAGAVLELQELRSRSAGRSTGGRRPPPRRRR